MLRDMLLDNMRDEVELGCALAAFMKHALIASREAATAYARPDWHT